MLSLMRALVTGANGFVGSHLIENLIACGAEVHAMIRSFRSDYANLEHLDAQKFSVHTADLTDEAAVADLIKSVKPTHIFHLAAQSYVPSSWEAPHATLAANINGTLNLLEAVRRHAPTARVQIAGSSEEYGRVEAEECPITEEQPLRPLSPYGVSKVAADMLARQYAASYGLNIVVTRGFNHTGPRRGLVFAESDWARQIALIEVGELSPVIMHGNLNAVRDYTDVRDMVRGYILAIEKGKPGQVYNLCSGPSASVPMRVVLESLIALARPAARRSIELRLDPARSRPSDVLRLIGDGSRARAELGWVPTITLGETLVDLLDYWRGQVGKNLKKVPA